MNNIFKVLLNKFKNKPTKKTNETIKKTQIGFIGKTKTVEIIDNQDVVDLVTASYGQITNETDDKLNKLKAYSDDEDAKSKKELNQKIDDNKQELQTNINDLKNYTDAEDLKIKQEVDGFYGGYHLTASEYDFLNIILNTNRLDTIQPVPNRDFYISILKIPLDFRFNQIRLNDVFNTLTKFDKQKPNSINCYIVVDSIQISLVGVGETQGFGGYPSAQQIRLTPNNQDFDLNIENVSFIHKKPWVSRDATNFMLKISIFRV